ncbi:MAG: cyclic nucleotide-binding domain-containing protein [Dehalococcoidia bacterium]|nr:MAG: cyclic nucleotide-binding domain-containing protein [Dehalococcoidia bacterium]
MSIRDTRRGERSRAGRQLEILRLGLMNGEVNGMTPKEALRECQAFCRLTDDKLEKIAALSSEQVFEAGATIFQAGSMAEQIFVLMQGKVALQMEAPMGQLQLRKRVTLDTIGNSELFGWSGIVEPYIYTLSAICLRTSIVLSIDARKLSSLLQEDCPIAYEVLQGLAVVISSRLHDTMQLLVTERSLA